ncbi:MAG: nitrate reductase [Candidatus Omnitrophica bacterium]|nr:nitrate reductase [Candidatus Omnitrophota bacterium]
MVVYEEGEETLWETSSIPDKELRWGKSVCPYCGVGCGVLVGEKEGKIHKVRGNPEHPANRGLLCAKGGTLPLMLDTPDRLSFPSLREKASSEFERANWEKTLGFIAEKTKAVLKNDGPEAFAFYISGQLLTEDYYVVNKLAKGFLGTNNVDSNSRLCMASAVAGYMTSLGADGPPTCYDDIEESNCFFLIGTNTAACHPVTFQRIKNRKASNPKEIKVIVADPRRTRTAEMADLHLPLKPGTDVALLNAMLHVIEKEGYLDQAFIRNHTADWEKLKNILPLYSPEKAAEICGIEASLIREAALLFAKASSALSFWSMGLNQSSSGVAKNNAVINLHLATGKIGKPGSGPFSLTGQPNAMGGRETGGLAHLLPGHRLIGNERHRAEMEQFWNVAEGRISPTPGLTAIELFRAVEAGKVKIIWIVATNPLASIPNLNFVKAALAKAELVICQDVYHPTETTHMAHVLLPAAQWSERDGTVTNSERRVSYLEKIREPPGEAKPDWQIFCEFARRMGFEKEFSFESAEDIYEEYKKTTRGTGVDIGGVSYARLKKEFIQWPCPDEHAGSTPRLYTDFRFPTSDGRARFQAREYAPPAEPTDEAYPFILTTGRVRDQWHTMTRTGKIDSLLKAEPYAFLELHRDDAEKLGIGENEMVEVHTRRGFAKAPAHLSENIRPGTCFMPFHWGSLWGEADINAATVDAFDPISKQPELKFCAARLTRLEPVKAET